MQSHKPFLLFILLCILLAPGCKGSKSDSVISGGVTGKSDSIKLKPGLSFKIQQHTLWLDPNTGKPTMGEGIRTITLDNGGGAEGLSFQWNLLSRPLSVMTPGASPAPLGQPQGALTVTEEQVWEGKMTLANTTEGKQMTLPLFWPPGELYLANSSAIWLSDQSFSELKKNSKARILPGLFGNAMLGPVQEIKIFPRVMDRLTAELQADPKKESEWVDAEVLGKKNMAVKVNGIVRSVPVLEVGTHCARFAVLDEVQNPLVLKFTLAPEADIAQILFSPLGVLKGFVDYQVTEIQLP